MKKNNTERFEQLGTKISPEMAEVLNAVCDALQVDVYHLLQWFAYTVIRAAAPHHSLTPEVQKIMTLLECDAGWQKAFNMANPDKLKVSQIILILEQEGHKGFGAVMIDKPFFEEARQTECVDDILERVTEVCMRGIYRRLRQMGGELECNNLSDVLLTMLDSQEMLNIVERDRNELPQMGEHTPSGKQIAFGKKTKAKQHRTPDSYANDKRVREQPLFEDFDRHPYPAGTTLEDWEGEHVDVKIKEKWQ